MKNLRTLLTTILLWLGAAGAAFAQQSAPNWSYGYVPTPAEWNHWFGVKSDWPGASGCLVTSCTMSGPIITAPSTASNAGLNVPPGVAPTTPNNGDIWSTTTGLYTRVNGSTYNLLATDYAAQGRLTLIANTPVMSNASATAQGTLRYDCYSGNGVRYYDGTGDQMDVITSCEVTDAMVSAASAGQVVLGNVYDVWWAHNGANHICLAMSTSTGGGGGWSADAGGSNTARGTGYTLLDRSTRPYITNRNAITNCFNGVNNYGTLLANQATYLGTVYASANGQISHTLGGAATAGLLGVWNMYNRVSLSTNVVDSGASTTYSSATPRQAGAHAYNQIQFVSGAAEDGTIVTYTARATTVAAASATAFWGIGFDSVTTFSQQPSLIFAPTAVITTGAGTNAVNFTAQIGFHTISANEASDGTNLNTFDTSSLNILSGNFRY